MLRYSMETEVVVRPLVRGDEAFLREVLYHALYVPEGESRPQRSVIEEPDLKRYVDGWMQRDGDIGLAAEVAAAPVGAAWLRLWRGQDRGYGFVDPSTPELSIAVLPEHRGRGYGSQLLTSLMDLAKDRFPGISLSVSSENRALGLYKRLGFSQIAEAGGSITMVWKP